ncbi:unnamed protein product [marine sediment metagenome]|uniref:Uncharacterized protein n=1 Tax=marine sediment metagenome TaxID=412755 RepID=X1KDE5_9ZZZZ
MNKTIVKRDGRRFRRWELPSGAVIESEIVESHEHTVPDSKEYRLLKKIANKLGVSDE